jgi:hypothetical protein
MTTGEACSLIVDLTRQLSAVRGECTMWRMLAQTSIQRASELARELEIIDQRRYVHRTRMQDMRDIWLDHTNLRSTEAA